MRNAHEISGTPSPRLPPLPSPRPQEPEDNNLEKGSEATSVTLLRWVDKPTAERKLRHGSLEGDVAKVKEALRDGAFVDHRDKHGNTPLMYACSRGRITVIRELLKCGADMDLPGADGGTCLHVAAKWGKASAVDELLRRGADVCDQDKFGRTAADVARLVFEADTDKCPTGVHPTEAALNLAAWGVGRGPAALQAPSSGPALAGQEHGQEPGQEPDEDQVEFERRRVADARAKATRLYAAQLTPHEQVVALLEDWVAAAEAIAENEAAVAEALETDAGDSEVVAGLRRKIAELTLVMDARAAEQAAWASKEAEARARAKGLAHEVAEAEQLLAGLAAALEADQGVAADANSAKKLAAFDLAKARLERVEKEVEVAKREGRPEVRCELEAMLPSLKDAKRKAQARAKDLLKARERPPKKTMDKAINRGRRGTISQQHEPTSPGTPLSPGSPTGTPAGTLGSPGGPGSPFGSTLARQFSETMDGGSLADDSVRGAAGGDQRAFEAADRFGGSVPSRLAVADDAWHALESLQAKIDRLRNQVRFLGERPHC